MRRAMLGVVAGAMLALPPPATAAPEIDPWHATHVCRFPTHGTVTIDLGGKRGVTMNGTFYPVQSGSYFFQGTEDAPLVDGDPFVIMFGPDMSWWDFRGERADDCTRRAASRSPDAGSAAPASDDRKLEGMDYKGARAIIVGEYGWTPGRGNCEAASVGEATCRDFPETLDCAGTGLGQCLMRFVKPGRCLIVGTRGGPPAPEVDGEPAVEHVTFMQRECP